MATRRRSKFSPPGDVVEGWSDDGCCLNVILATSRHKHEVSLEQSKWLLAHELAEYVGWPDKPDVEQGYPFGMERAVTYIHEAMAEKDMPVFFWRSITKAEIDQERHYCGNEGCDEDWASWCSEGAGKRWMKMVSGDVSQAENVLYDRAIQWGA